MCNADMSVYAAVMLIPLSVVIYTVAGGLKATFTSSYLHTVRSRFICHGAAPVARRQSGPGKGPCESPTAD